MGRLSHTFPTANSVDAALKRANKAEVDVIDLKSKVSKKVDHSEYATETQNLQEQINNIVAEASESGDVSYEVVQARVDAEGTNYTTLKERLDTNQNTVQNQINAITESLFPVTCGTWELGTIDNSGNPSETSRYARTVNFIELESGKLYTVNGFVKYNVEKIPKIAAFFYDDLYEFVSGSDVSGLRFKADAKYVKLVYCYEGADTDVSLADARLTELAYISTVGELKDNISAINRSLKTGIQADKFTWEHGLIGLTDGQDYENRHRQYMRTVGYIENPTYNYLQFDYPETATVAQLPAKLTIYFYDESFQFVGQKAVANGKRMQIQSAYYRLVYFYNGTPSTVIVSPFDAAEVECKYKSVIKDNQRDSFEKMLMVDGKYIYGNLKWEAGLINMKTGQDSNPANAKYMRTVGYFKTPTNLPITFSADVVSQTEQTPLITAYFYDENKVLKETPNVTGRTMVINYPYFRLVYFYNDTPIDVDIEDAETTTYSYVPEFKLPISDVVQARVDAEGTNYTTLKERLDTNQNTVQNQINAITESLFPVPCGTWELGSIDNSGNPSETSRYARSSDFIQLNPEKIYTVSGYAKDNVGKTPKVTAYFYDETYTYISGSDVTGLRFKADGKFMKLVYFYQGTDTDVSLFDARLTELNYISDVGSIKIEAKSVIRSLETGLQSDGFTWEHGLIDLSDGTDRANRHIQYMRTVGYTKKPTDDYLQFDFPTTASVALATKVTIYFYDAHYQFIGQKAVTNGERMKPDYPYFRLVYFYQGSPSTITVNPSDAEEVKCVYQSIIKDNQRDSFEKMLMVDGKYIYGNLKWEAGLINMKTGQDSNPANAKYMRTVGYFKTPTNLPITFSTDVVSQTEQKPLITAYFYDENKVLKETPNVTGRTMVVSYPYFRLVYFYQNTPIDVDIEDAETTTFSYVPDFKLPITEVKNNSSDIARLGNCLFDTGELSFGANDLTWEHGIINMSTGQDNPTYNKKFARNIGYIKTPTDRPMTFTASAPINSEQTPKITIYYYDSEKELVSTTDITGKTVTIDYPYFRLVYFYQNTPVDVDLRDAQTTQYGYVPKLQLSIPIIGTFTRNKYVAFGDSITWGHLRGSGTGSDRASDPYPSVVARSLGLDVTYGAQTGSGWVHPSGNKTAVTIVDSFDCSNYNLATLAFGTNDWYGNIPMGTLSDTNTTTIIGAMKHCIEKILSDNPSICLIIITPINAKNLNAIDGAKVNQGNYRYNTPNTQGVTLEQICEAEVQVAEYYGIPCIDNSKGSIVNRQNTANGSIFIDTLHPTNDFYKTLGQYYSGRIGEYFRGYVPE